MTDKLLPWDEGYDEMRRGPVAKLAAMNDSMPDGIPWNVAMNAGTVRQYHDGTSRPDQVFVFGSNLMGDHAGGAARFAEERRAAVMGIGQGFTERRPLADGKLVLKSYALPTCALPGVPLTFDGVRAAVTLFKAFAYVREDLEFFVTAVGCGIAGFKHEDIAPMFRDAPMNCVLPPEWKEIIGS
jgi:hypothetical protein